jgi:hypothetical protein
MRGQHYRVVASSTRAARPTLSRSGHTRDALGGSELTGYRHLNVVSGRQSDATTDKAGLSFIARSVCPFGHFLAQRCPFQQSVERRA